MDRMGLFVYKLSLVKLIYKISGNDLAPISMSYIIVKPHNKYNFRSTMHWIALYCIVLYCTALHCTGVRIPAKKIKKYSPHFIETPGYYRVLHKFRPKNRKSMGRKLFSLDAKEITRTNKNMTSLTSIFPYIQTLTNFDIFVIFYNYVRVQGKSFSCSFVQNLIRNPQLFLYFWGGLSHALRTKCSIN